MQYSLRTGVITLEVSPVFHIEIIGQFGKDGSGKRA